MSPIRPPESPAAPPRAESAPRGSSPLIRDPSAPCRNCGDQTYGNFCPTCGQRKGDPRASLRRLAVEFADDQFSLNSTLPRTMAALLLHPGFLTREYLDGRIARYVAPFRVYLLASVIFFLLLSFYGMLAVERGTANVGNVNDALQVARDSILADPELARNPARRDSAVAALEQVRARAQGVSVSMPADPSWADNASVRTGFPAIDRRIRARISTLAAMPPQQAIRSVARDTLNRAPMVVFLLLPFFALLMKLLYIRQRRYYVEHFIFALHLHAFWFVAFTVMLLFRNTWVLTIMSLWILLYVFLAMKRVYGQGVLKTGVKYVALAWTYPFFVMAGVLAIALLTLVFD